MTPASKEILSVLVEVIRDEMGLKNEQVVIYNQRWPIPPDDRLYIVLTLSGTKVYGANAGWAQGFVTGTPDQVITNLEEEISVNAQDIVTINVYSKSEAARIRRNEVILALASLRSERAQEACSFSIGRVPISYADTSQVEGTAILNRYSITFNVLYSQGIKKPTEYYNQFPTAETALQP